MKNSNLTLSDSIDSDSTELEVSSTDPEKEKENIWNKIEKVGKTGNISIMHYDSLLWLESLEPHTVRNFVSGLPDYNEVKKFIPTIEEYIKWFYKIAKLMFRATDKDGYCILQQTDRKIGKKISPTGNTIILSKSYMLIKAAKKQKNAITLA